MLDSKLFFLFYSFAIMKVPYLLVVVICAAIVIGGCTSTKESDEFESKKKCADIVSKREKDYF